MVNDTTRLLGLDGLVVERVEVDATGVPVVDLSTGCEQARCCPGCGQRAARVKQWATTRPRDLPVAVRPVWCDGAGITETRVYGRNELPVGWETIGPAVIEQVDATTLVPPNVEVTVDPWHNLVMDLS